MEQFKVALLTIIFALLTACGSNSTDPAATLTTGLAASYPDGKLPADRAAEAAIYLAQNPAVLNYDASAGNALANTSNITPQAYTASYAAVQRAQNTSLFGSYFFSIYPSEMANALATNPTWNLEGPAFYASLTPSDGLAPVWRFRNLLNGSYLYTINDGEKNDIIANYSTYFILEGPAWYASPVPATGLTPLYRFRNLTNGTYLFSAYESEKDDIVAKFPSIFKLEGVSYYVNQNMPVTPACAAAPTGTTSCSATVGGTVVGLGSGKTVTLSLNGSTDLSVSASSFQFPTVLTTGQLYTVTIKTQPAGQMCSIANGSGTIATGNVTNIAVTCQNLATVGGSLSGLIAGASVTLTLNGGGDLTLNAGGSFAFITTVPYTQTYVVLVKTQPVGQTCTVASGTGTVSSNISNVVVTCTKNAPTGLLISEVASCIYYNDSCWFEVFNPTAFTINLSAYSLKSNAIDASNVISIQTMPLPSLSLAPNKYAIVMANPSNNIKNLNPQTALVNSAGFIPFWGSSGGFIELILNTSSSTADFVRFGTNATSPTTTNHWSGSNVPAMPYALGYSIVRPVSTINLQDTQSAADWISVSFTTPGGQNDVPAGAVDTDNDGIPDSSEVAGSTYAGLDLYSMGARQGVRDIFIEVDAMNSTDPGIIPRTESLQKVVDAFAVKGIAVHFDVGTQFSATFSPANFNLGQGNNTVTYESCVTFDTALCASNVSVFKTIYDWKLANFDRRRLNIFHYMLFGNQDAAGSGGRAELNGNDIVITLGNLGYTTTAGINLNFLINAQATVMMHELGHNLGLRHGGNEEVNYKPNYYSIMNYLYSNKGLAQSASSIGPFQRWNGTNQCSMLNSDCGSPSQFIIDYSNGSSADLNESFLSESFNIGRGADASVYADWNGNGSNDAATYARDLNNDGSFTILKDYNDWGNILLPFNRSYSGQAAPNPNQAYRPPFDPMTNDRQAFSDCTPPAANQIKFNLLKTR